MEIKRSGLQNPYHSLQLEHIIFLNIKVSVQRAEGMAQAIDGLPSKCKVLSSRPSTAKKKNYHSESRCSISAYC
jgi:hypothetical protein